MFVFIFHHAFALSSLWFLHSPSHLTLKDTNRGFFWRTSSNLSNTSSVSVQIHPIPDLNDLAVSLQAQKDKLKDVELGNVLFFTLNDRANPIRPGYLSPRARIPQ